MQQTITKINERRKTRYLLHERTLLMKNILGFREIYSILWSLKYIAYWKVIPKARAFRTSLTKERIEKKKGARKRGGGGSERMKKCAEFWEASSIYRGWNAFEKLVEWSEYELGCVLIPKKLKKVRFISIQKPSGCARICANWHSKNAEWPSWAPDPCLSFGPFWTSVLRFFEPGLALRHVFNPYSKN